MLGEELSRALSDISDDKIEAAAGIVPKSRNHIWLRVAAVAAVVALVIGMMAALWDGTEPGEQMGMPTVGTTVAPTELPTTLPDVPTEPAQKEIIETAGVLKLYACDAKNVSGDNIEQYELSSDKPFLLALWNPLINASNFALPLTFQISEDYFGTAEITFDICSEYGGFGQKPNDYENYRNQITLAEGNQLYFGGDSLWNAATDIGEGKSFFADIIIYADGKVVGYGVISFCFKGATCYAYEFTTFCFPSVDGQLQDVSEEYVQLRIEEYKQKKNSTEVV